MNEQVINSQRCGEGEGDSQLHTIRPSYRASEGESGVTLHVALPGVRKEAVDLSFRENILSIRASREDSTPADWQVRREAAKPDAYELKIRLHGSLDPAKTSAALANGVLSLQIGKRDEALPRRIEIN